jgi:hypothetical protein
MHVAMFPEFLQTENGNFCLFAVKGNGELPFFCCKEKLIFLGREMINSNQRLLFQQMCPSMHIRKCCVASKA